MRKTALLAVLIATVMVVPIAAFAIHSFTDVPDGAFFHNSVAWMKDNGITVGCNPPTNSQYCPNDNVSRGEMAVFLKRLSENKVVDAATAVNADNATKLGGDSKSSFQQWGDTLPPDESLTGAWGLNGDGALRVDDVGKLERKNAGPISLMVSPELRGHDPREIIRLWDVEGESDLVACLDAGMVHVISGTGGASCLKGHDSCENWLLSLRPEEVAVVGDLDDAGQKGAEKRAQWWLNRGVPVRIEVGDRKAQVHALRPLRRPGGHQRADPPWSARLRHGGRLRPAKNGTGGGPLRPSRPRAGARVHIRHHRVSRAGDAHRQRPGRLQPGRGRCAPEGDG